jgi:hypothetical protein
VHGQHRRRSPARAAEELSPRSPMRWCRRMRRAGGMPVVQHAGVSECRKAKRADTVPSGKVPTPGRAGRGGARRRLSSTASMAQRVLAQRRGHGQRREVDCPRRWRPRGRAGPCRDRRSRSSSSAARSPAGTSRSMAAGLALLAAQQPSTSVSAPCDCSQSTTFTRNSGCPSVRRCGPSDSRRQRVTSRSACPDRPTTSSTESRSSTSSPARRWHQELVLQRPEGMRRADHVAGNGS